MAEFLIYGAYGYTGELIAREAVERGHKPILAGRNANKLQMLSSELGLKPRAIDLDDATALDAALRDVPIVLHCAGPFAHTSKAVVDSCLRCRTHYLDITGEVDVFESVAARDDEAKQARVMLLPGVGFDVVPSDCLAAHLHRRLPSATHLTLAFQGIGRLSRGTATTMTENLHRGCVIRRNGRLTPVPSAWASREIDFGRGPVKTIGIPWGDVSTAFHSTGIPNIEVFMAAPRGMRVMSRVSRYLGWLLGSSFVQNRLKRRIQAGPRGPSTEERQRGESHLWGEVRDVEGRRAVSRMHTPEGYTLTMLTALAVVERVLAGQSPAGFQTPSKAYGADFVLETPGVQREDIEQPHSAAV